MFSPWWSFATWPLECREASGATWRVEFPSRNRVHSKRGVLVSDRILAYVLENARRNLSGDVLKPRLDMSSCPGASHAGTSSWDSVADQIADKVRTQVAEVLKKQSFENSDSNLGIVPESLVVSRAEDLRDGPHVRESFRKLDGPAPRFSGNPEDFPRWHRRYQIYASYHEFYQALRAHKPIRVGSRTRKQLLAEGHTPEEIQRANDAWFSMNCVTDDEVFMIEVSKHDCPSEAYASVIERYAALSDYAVGELSERLTTMKLSKDLPPKQLWRRLGVKANALADFGHQVPPPLLRQLFLNALPQGDYGFERRLIRGDPCMPSERVVAIVQQRYDELQAQNDEVLDGAASTAGSEGGGDAAQQACAVRDSVEHPLGDPPGCYDCDDYGYRCHEYRSEDIELEPSIVP